MSGSPFDADGPTQWPPTWELAQTLIASRESVLPKRLFEPGPDAAQLRALLSLAATAPDHGQLTPWRFIIIAADKRRRLSEVFGLALTDRDPDATPEQIASAREKAYRAPLVMAAIACLGPREPNTPPLERMVTMGAAIQNLLLGAHAMGFAASLTSGQAMGSPRMRELLRLGEGESAVCCVNVGTADRHKPATRTRPDPDVFTTTL